MGVDLVALFVVLWVVVELIQRRRHKTGRQAMKAAAVWAAVVTGLALIPTSNALLGANLGASLAALAFTGAVALLVFWLRIALTRPAT